MDKKNEERQKRTQIIKQRVKEIGTHNENTSVKSDFQKEKNEKKSTSNTIPTAHKSKTSSNKTNDGKRPSNENPKHYSKIPKVEIPSETSGINATTGCSAIKARFIMFLKDRHLKNNTTFLSLDEILIEMKETSQTDYTRLTKDLLDNNEKIEIENDTYRYKPRYIFKNKTELLQIIKTRYSMGLIVSQDDVLESHGQGELWIKRLINKNNIYSFKAKHNKVLLIYKEDLLPIPKETDITDFQHLFFATKIEEHDRKKYREEKGTATDGTAIAKVFKKPTAKRTKNRKKAVIIKSNQHLAHTLEDYSK